MISNYLRKFVEDNHRVIIPNVGAFLRKNNANISFKASITFSPFLRFNDGLLENLVAEKENISKEAAAEKVSRFIQDMKACIAGKRPFYIKNLGAFYQDERNAVQFIYAETEQEARSKFREVVEVEIVEVVEAAAVENDAPLRDYSEKEEIISVPAEEEPTSVAESEEPRQNAPQNQAQQLETASDSLQRWMAKRKKDVEEMSKSAKQPENPPKIEHDDFDIASSGQSNATPTLAEAAHPEQAQKPQQEGEHPSPNQAGTADEAKQLRQEAIARALAEKKRKEQARREAEEAAKTRGDAAQTTGENSAPLVPGAWEKDVMGKRKSRSSAGILVFLVIVALIFVTGILSLLYEHSMSDFFGEASEAGEVSVPPEKTALQSPAPTPAPVRQPNAYYIVTGVFNFENNAHTVSQKLYAAQKLKTEVVTLHDGKFAVSLSRYDSNDAALKNINKYKKLEIDVWVAY
ncbi:MAG: HU family DNA-binding protein [Prevotellaceae bacterium]|jgi:nucleoid DNA-binding protein|nr:HU family DNA-binding protein [Prevotellaceae bacterium]